MKTILILLTAILFTTSCDNHRSRPEVGRTEVVEDMQMVEVNDDYLLSIPRFMQKTDDLNDEASLQYQNIIKAVFVIVMEESKEDFINVFKGADLYKEEYSTVENYRRAYIESLGETTEITYASAAKSKIINGLPAEFIRLDGKPDDTGVEIAYFLTFIEGEENMYMIMSWTLKSRGEKYKALFEDIASSFKLLGKGNKGHVEGI